MKITGLHFLVTLMVIWCIVMVGPTSSWSFSDHDPEDYLYGFNKWWQAQRIAFRNRRWVKKITPYYMRLYKLPINAMLWGGVFFVGIAKSIVSMFGFDRTGVRKNTPASFLVRRQGGTIKKDSWLAKGQSTGVNGLGFPLFALSYGLGVYAGYRFYYWMHA